MNTCMERQHYFRFELTMQWEYSLASPPPAATIARRANALFTVRERAYPIEQRVMSTGVWMELVGQRQAELRTALATVGPKDRFLNRSRIPSPVWIEIAGKAAMLYQAVGITSRDLSTAITEYSLQVRHANAARAALKELACPSGPDAMEARRARLIKAWIVQNSTRRRATGELQPIRSRAELRNDVRDWNAANRLKPGIFGFVSTNGSPDELLRRLAHAEVRAGLFMPKGPIYCYLCTVYPLSCATHANLFQVNKKLAAEDTISASERMSSCPGLGTNDAPPAGIPPSQWSSASARARELLLAATATRGSNNALEWFSTRAEMMQEVALERFDEYDDQRDVMSDEESELAPEV